MWDNFYTLAHFKTAQPPLKINEYQIITNPFIVYFQYIYCNNNKYIKFNKKYIQINTTTNSNSNIIFMRFRHFQQLSTSF